MADAQQHIDNFRALLTLYRRNHDLEVRRATAIIQAEAFEDRARGLGDEMLDADMMEIIDERERLTDLANELRREARKHEAEQRRIMWAAKEIGDRSEAA